MPYLLDTDVFSAIARDLQPKLAARVAVAGPGALAVSIITEGEVRYGIAHGALPARLAARIEALLAQLPCLPLPRTAVHHYATLRAHLRQQGTPIGPNDLWIAAHALAEGLTLVSGNEREFRRVPGLQVENWLR